MLKTFHKILHEAEKTECRKLVGPFVIGKTVKEFPLQTPKLIEMQLKSASTALKVMLQLIVFHY